MIIKMALKELRNQPRLSLLFALSLAVGLSAFLIVDSFRIGVDKSLNSRAKNILAADIGFGARRFLNDSEVKAASALIPGIQDSTSTIESFSMLATKTNSRLVQLKAVGKGYPYYGDIVFEKTGKATPADFKALFEQDIVWMYPEIMLQLGLSEGDEIQLGQQKFKIAATIIVDSSGVGTGFSFAPPIYMSMASIEKTNLLGLGSRAYYSHLFKLAEPNDPEEIAEVLFQHFTDPGIRVLTPKSSSEQVGRILGYLGDYMGLASLIAIFLTAFGCGYLYRSYLSERIREVALYKSLGLKDSQVEGLYCLHVIFLSSIALVPLLALTFILAPQLSYLASELSGTSIDLSLQWRTIVLGIIIALFGGLLSTYPLIRGLRKTNAKSLLSGIRSQSVSRTELLFYLPLIVLYAALSLYLSRSFQVGGGFLAGVVVSLLLLFGFSQISLKALGALETLKDFRWRWVIKSVTRNPASYRSGFIALSFGILLTLLLPQLEHGILKEINLGDRADRPSLFLFDIQQDQNIELQEWLNQQQVEPQVIAPMIRARLMTVNGKEFEKGDRDSLTREQERENRFRNRGFNLTYRDELSPSETLLEGEFWTSSYSGEGYPEISIETRFADRLDLKLGDILQFEIQGVPVEGKITSRRKVRWTSFQPNFFVQFQPNAIDEAPGTFLTTIGSMGLDKKSQLQIDLVKNFPNVSAVDVSRLVERLSSIVSQASLALKAMAIIALIVGFLIFYAIIQRRSYEKKYQANLLRSLGASQKQVAGTYMGEFLILSGSALLLGTALSLFAVYLLGFYIFDGAFAVNYQLLGYSALAITLLSFIVISLSLHSLMKQNLNSLLQESVEQAT